MLPEKKENSSRIEGRLDCPYGKRRSDGGNQKKKEAD